MCQINVPVCLFVAVEKPIGIKPNGDHWWPIPLTTHTLLQLEVTGEKLKMAPTENSIRELLESSDDWLDW